MYSKLGVACMAMHVDEAEARSVGMTLCGTGCNQRGTWPLDISCAKFDVVKGRTIGHAKCPAQIAKNALPTAQRDANAEEAKAARDENLVASRAATNGKLGRFTTAIIETSEMLCDPSTQAGDRAAQRLERYFGDETDTHNQALDSKRAHAEARVLARGSDPPDDAPHETRLDATFRSLIHRGKFKQANNLQGHAAPNVDNVEDIIRQKCSAPRTKQLPPTSGQEDGGSGPVVIADAVLQALDQVNLKSAGGVSGLTLANIAEAVLRTPALARHLAIVYTAILNGRIGGDASTRHATKGDCSPPRATPMTFASCRWARPS